MSVSRGRGISSCIKNPLDGQFVPLSGYLIERSDGCQSSELSADGAAMAKLWASEATSAIDDLVQMFGGYGYMREYAIARALTDVRPNRIYGGSSEIMKEIISRTL